ncbi:MAG: hypothetical protein ABSG45_05335 [Nitrososphaerales archaeon]
MRAKTYARIFGAVLLFTSAWKLLNHYTGVWSPFLFRQSAFDGDTVLALVGIVFACMMLLSRETSWDLAIIVSLLAGFKLVTKFLPSNNLNVHGGLGPVPDVLWCVYMVFCAVVMAQYSKRIARRELGSLNSPASAPTR